MSSSRSALRLLALVAAAVIFMPARPAHAVKLAVDENNFVNLNFLVQPWAQMDANPSATLGAKAFDWSFYLRRTRFILSGQVSKWVVFFFETDAPNWGKGGEWAPNTLIVQDAFVTFQIHDAFRVSTGMILLPFTHHFRQSAASLLTLDYHTALNKYPADSHRVWRGMGVEVGGVLLSSHIDYRVALTNGSPTAWLPTKEGASMGRPPRITGRVGANVMDPDSGFFFAGTSLGKKKVMSGGFSFDVQPDAFGKGKPYWVIAGDLVLDVPVNDLLRLSGQWTLVHYGSVAVPENYVAADGVTQLPRGGAAATGAGTGMAFDFGMGVGNWQPVTIMLDWFRPSGSTTIDGDFFGFHYGPAWFIQGHNANIKLDFAVLKASGLAMSAPALQWTLQTQLLF